MGSIRGLALQGPRQDRFDLRIADLARLSRTRFIEQAIYPLGTKALPPLAHRLNVNLHLPGHGGAAMPVRQTQYNTGAQSQRLGRGSPAHPLQQDLPLGWRHHRDRQSRSSPQGSSPAMLDVAAWKMYTIN